MMRRFMITAALLSTLLFLVSCGGQGDAGNGAAQSEDAADTAHNSVQVGAVLSLTGEYAVYGNSIKRGMDLAIEKLNKEGGIKGADFSIIYEDAASNVETARSAFNKLIRQNIHIILGAETSDLSKELIPLARNNEVIMISPSASSPSVMEVEDDGYFFRICASDQSEASQLAADIIRQHKRYEFIKRGYKRALILARKNNPYTVDLGRAIGRDLAHSNITYEILFFDADAVASGGEELDEILAKAADYRRRSNDPQKEGAVVVFGFGDDVLALLKAFKDRFYDESVDSEYFEEKMNLLVYTSSAVDTTDFFVKSAGFSEGLIFPRVFDPQMKEIDIVREFVEAYEAKYEEKPDLYSAYGFDTAMLIGLTLRREHIEEYLKEPFNFRMHMNDVGFQGVTGSVDFQQTTGEVAKTPTLYKMIAHGQAIPLNDFEQMRLDETIRKLRESMRGGS